MSAAVMQRQAARDDKPYSFFAFSPERVLGIKRAAEVRSPAARRRHPRLANRRDSPRHIRLRDAKRARDSRRRSPDASYVLRSIRSPFERQKKAASSASRRPRGPRARRYAHTRPLRIYDISARRRVATDSLLAAPPSLARRLTTVSPPSRVRFPQRPEEDDDEEVRTAPPRLPFVVPALPLALPSPDVFRDAFPTLTRRASSPDPRRSNRRCVTPEIQDPHLGDEEPRPLRPAQRGASASRPVTPSNPRATASFAPIEIALAAVACLSPFSSSHVPAAKPVAPLPPSQRAEASKKASIPAPRIVPGDTGAENDAPPRAVAFTPRAQTRPGAARRHLSQGDDVDDAQGRARRGVHRRVLLAPRIQIARRSRTIELGTRGRRA